MKNFFSRDLEFLYTFVPLSFFHFDICSREERILHFVSRSDYLLIFWMRLIFSFVFRESGVFLWVYEFVRYSWFDHLSTDLLIQLIVFQLGASQVEVLRFWHSIDFFIRWNIPYMNRFLFDAHIWTQKSISNIFLLLPTFLVYALHQSHFI